MVQLLSITAGIVLTALATAQKFNTWPQHNYGDWYNHTDGDVTTSGSPTIPPGGAARFSFLFNRADPPYAGFYVQSSGDYITDYTVHGLGFGIPVTKGRVCGARGNFTFVPLTGPNGEPPSKWADTLFLDVTAAKNGASKATINEIWPVWVGDEIFHPNNTSPCPPGTKRVRRSA
ncbi:hypothetical protein LY78DRAFT_658156 [Colletotrichum sublineola]|uniref:Uncharacterized protein n=1 Tax=Colletotrichum sublineola TaxID=1173701 RepID=A0A066XXI8_COLSU|nr:hypothetical protein LY78DRAFT_658156 [Colletotrichum sublineola]KDN70491.1 hypothetical protein CSUB01_07750 [Colletotrichum sublineola]